VTPATPQSRDGQAPQTVLVARAADHDPDTTEIHALATAAGYDVVEAITQRRRADPTYGVGRGTAETVARRATAVDADVVVYDGSLSPGQTFSLGDLLPDSVTVIDRPRLVLGLIAAASDSRATTLRFELATRRYELPRLREVVGRDGHARRLRPEGAGRVRDLERQIARLEDDLEACASTATATDDGRADATSNDADPGPSRVAVVGYANVGKSLLCQRLDAWTEGKPAATQTDDLAPTTGSKLDAVTDQPLTTVGTSTTTITLAGRRLRLTDTTGIVAGLPGEALGAFDRTRAAVREATVTLLVIDASTDLSALERRLTAVVDVLDDHHHDVIPVVTHVDRLESQCGVGESTAVTDTTDAAATESVTTDSDTTASDTASFVTSRTTAIADELAAVGLDPPCDPIPLDAHSGTGIDAVVSAVVDALPTATETLTVAYGGDVQTTLSWAYDRDLVTDVSYDEDGIDVSLAGRPESVAAAVRRFER
jgi:GTP-binding protein HflX